MASNAEVSTTAAGPGGPLDRGQQQFAMQEAPERVEQRVLGLVLDLHRLGLGEGRISRGGLALLVQGVHQRGGHGHAPAGIAAAIGTVHRAARVGHRRIDPARRHGLLLDVVSALAPQDRAAEDHAPRR
jgi:hypothetical protein